MPTEKQPHSAAMNSVLFLGFVFLLPGFIVAGPESCTLSDVLSLNSLVSSIASTMLGRIKLDCVDITTKGSFAHCPSDYTVTGCACGSGCGSWDVQNQITCHCQCANMDWTNSRCCKIASK
ncbi:resistin-like [Ambystoma mexicanum]|uniref:resistin-like n=1 Tax=Ambystoma mexicanum TaxID=8296 RepID=UPI0037E8CF54